MDKTPDPKKFDCVEMKRRAQERIYEEIRGMTPEQELEYWKRHERTLTERIAAAKAKRVA